MSKLLIFEDGNQIGERELDQERVRIGRKGHNDLLLPHSAVSGDHAVVITIRNDSFLEDLHSTNGTWVNGRMISKRLLQDGDEIRIARYTLRYVFEARAGELAPRPVPRSLISPAPPGGGPETCQDTPNFTTHRLREPVGHAEDATLPLGALRILSGPSSGKEVELVRTLTTLGKPGIQVAVITRRESGYFVAYVEGGDYPLVNGEPVEDDAPVNLRDLDDVEIAGVKMKFLLKRPAAGAA